MSYTIYPDVMLLWSMVINFFTIIIVQKILHIKNTYKSALVWSFFTGVMTIVEYILCLPLNKYAYHIIYVLSYIFMIKIFFNPPSIKELIKIIFIVFIVMLFTQGALSVRYSYIIPDLSAIIVVFSLGLMVTLITSKYKTHTYSKENVFNIVLEINKKSLSLKGYLDTGNLLTDPYSGIPAIILDYRVLKNCLSKEAYSYIDTYHKTGEFDYLGVHSHTDICFYPLPYKTISTNFTTMPAFKTSYSDFFQKNMDVVCGISRFKIKNNNDYQVLLNESLKPYREENSND